METRICSECGDPRPADTFRDGIDANACFRCRASSAQFQGADERSMAVRQKDRDFVKDGDAYWRLRKQGLQPRGIDKSAMAEQLASCPAEIEIGRTLHPTERKALLRQNGHLDALI